MGALPHTACALWGSTSLIILRGGSKRGLQLQRGAFLCTAICWVIRSREVHLAVFPCVGDKSASQLTSYTSAGQAQALWSTGPEPAGLPGPHALCLSCLPAAGAADGVA